MFIENSIINQIYNFFVIYFTREKSFYSLPKSRIINNIVDFYIRKIFPFCFPQKIKTIVSSCSVILSRNFFALGIFSVI